MNLADTVYSLSLKARQYMSKVIHIALRRLGQLGGAAPLGDRAAHFFQLGMHFKARCGEFCPVIVATCHRGGKIGIVTLSRPVRVLSHLAEFKLYLLVIAVKANLDRAAVGRGKSQGLTGRQRHSLTPQKFRTRISILIEGVGRATAQGIHKNGGGYRSAVDSPNCHRSAGQRVDTRRTKVPPTS